MLYTFETESTDDLLALLAENLRKRRLEKGLSRKTLSQMSGVPVPTIAKFERQHTISLPSFVAMARSLGYTEQLKSLIAEPLYSTMAELTEIHRNSNRQRGTRHETY